jgi:hypothetical protein
VSYYKVSALGFGFARMWRGWAVIVPVIVVNAALQALLIVPDPTPGLNAPAVILGVLSALVFLVAYALVAATALEVPKVRVGWSTTMGVVRRHATGYAVSALVLATFVVIGLALYTIPGLLIIALTPFLLLAALDGQRNPIGANFATIGRRFWRWLVTTTITGLVVVIGWLLAGLFAFFMRGMLASFIVWTVAGLVGAWFTTAWALIYRSAQPRRMGPDASSD